jgi:putative membrane protein
MPTFLQRHGRWAGALTLIAALAACPGEDRTVQEDRAEIGAEYEDANVLADLNGHLAASIEGAEAAQQHATHPEVRQLAQTVEQDHRQKQQQLANIMQQHGLMGVEPDATGRIDDHVGDVRNLHDQSRGEDFDKAYVDMVVDRHRSMLNRIDDALDRTERADFRQSLQQMRPEMEQHLRHAEQLRDRLDDYAYDQQQPRN